MTRFVEVRNVLKFFLQTRKGKIGLAFDMWKARQGLEYQCITAHYIDDDWKLNKRIILFKTVEYPYTSITLGEAIGE